MPLYPFPSLYLLPSTSYLRQPLFSLLDFPLVRLLFPFASLPLPVREHFEAPSALHSKLPSTPSSSLHYLALTPFARLVLVSWHISLHLAHLSPYFLLLALPPASFAPL